MQVEIVTSCPYCEHLNVKVLEFLKHEGQYDMQTCSCTAQYIVRVELLIDKTVYKIEEAIKDTCFEDVIPAINSNS